MKYYLYAHGPNSRDHEFMVPLKSADPLEVENKLVELAEEHDWWYSNFETEDEDWWPKAKVMMVSTELEVDIKGPLRRMQERIDAARKEQKSRAERMEYERLRKKFEAQ